MPSEHDFPLRALRMWPERRDDLSVVDFFFREEWEHYRAAERRPDAFPILKHLCQALFWACALDQAMSEPPTALPGYPAFLASHRSLGVLNGVRYVRNRVAHQFNTVLMHPIGRDDEFRWKVSAKLPTPTRSHEEKKRPDYDAHLAGALATDTLRVLAEYFEDAHAALGAGPTVGGFSHGP